MKSIFISLALPALFVFTGCLDSADPYDDTEDLAFLADYAQESGVDSTSNGLLYRIIEQGEGARPGPESIVIADLEGASIDGEVTVNTFDGDFPAIISLERDLAGFREGFQLMNAGSTFEMAFPTRLAYGDGRVLFFDRVEFLNTQENFIAEYTQQEDVVPTDSGLRYRVITEGEGEHPDENSTVTINYTGTLINGAEFDSNPGDPITWNFSSSPPISGFLEGVQLMTPGSTYEFLIPENLAYGDAPPSGLYPGAALIFEVELLEVQ